MHSPATQMPFTPVAEWPSLHGEAAQPPTLMSSIHSKTNVYMDFNLIWLFPNVCAKACRH